MKKSELIGKSGYILANTKAAISFLRNLDGARLMKGEIKIKKHWKINEKLYIDFKFINNFSLKTNFLSENGTVQEPRNVSMFEEITDLIRLYD